MTNIKIKCNYCKGTGDWRGEYGKKMFDFKSSLNKCLHCNGTGLEEKKMNECKYCGQPCTGYACNGCLGAFEIQKAQEEDYDSCVS